MNDYFEKEEQDNGRLIINDISAMYLKEGAKWAKILAIVGFIGVGLMVIAAIFALVMGSQLGAMGMTFSLVYILFAVLYYFPMSYLYKFADKMKKGLELNEQGLINESFENHKSFFKFLGIMTVVLMSLYALILVFSLLFGLGSTLF